jgi:hypothetical protein
MKYFKGDIKAIDLAIKALNMSTDRKSLQANINFITDYYIGHPSGSLPKHLNTHRSIIAREKWNERRSKKLVDAATQSVIGAHG